MCVFEAECLLIERLCGGHVVGAATCISDFLKQGVHDQCSTQSMRARVSHEGCETLRKSALTILVLKYFLDWSSLRLQRDHRNRPIR